MSKKHRNIFSGQKHKSSYEVCYDTDKQYQTDLGQQ